VNEVLLASWLEDPAERILTYRRLAHAMTSHAQTATNDEPIALEAAA
jgi:hypothetical protein